METINTPVIFNDIACKYDFINHILTFGVDNYWRKEFVKKIPKNNGYNNIIDIATGTGGMLPELKKLHAKNYYAIDPAEKMLNIARKKYDYAKCVNAFAESIPFNSNFADIISVSFGIRNFKNPKHSFKEAYRVLNENGLFAIMEFDVPQKGFFSYPYLFYFNKILPYLGETISGNNIAYKYFQESVHKFNSSFNIKNELLDCGFKIISTCSLFFGIVKIYISQKSGLRNSLEKTETELPMFKDSQSFVSLS